MYVCISMYVCMHVFTYMMIELLFFRTSYESSVDIELVYQNRSMILINSHVLCVSSVYPHHHDLMCHLLMITIHAAIYSNSIPSDYFA